MPAQCWHIVRPST